MGACRVFKKVSPVHVLFRGITRDLPPFSLALGVFPFYRRTLIYLDGRKFYDVTLCGGRVSATDAKNVEIPAQFADGKKKNKMKSRGTSRRLITVMDNLGFSTFLK